MIKEADLILPLFLCLILISLLSGKKNFYRTTILTNGGLEFVNRNRKRIDTVIKPHFMHL